MDKTVKRLLTNFPRILGVHYQSRCYSFYPKHYKKPLSALNEIEQSLKDENAEIHKFPLQAANNSAIFSVFYDPVVNAFSSFIMRKGNRILADNLIHETFAAIKRIQLKKFNEAEPENKTSIDLDPISLLKKALSNCKPALTTRKLKRSGVWYNIPCAITPKKANMLAMKYLVQATMEKGKNERFVTVLANEIIQAANFEGKAIQIKIDLHKYCESNRAYAHYRWT